MKRKIISFLLIFILLVQLFPCNDTDAADSKGYLVLIQTFEGEKWIAYDNLVCKSPDGNLMIHAYDTSHYIGLDYHSFGSGKTFSISNLNEQLIFTKNSAKYKYNLSSFVTLLKSENRTATYKAYTSSSFEKAANVVDYATLSDISIYTKYYTASEAAEYSALGYKGVICYSAWYEIEGIPEVKNVRDKDGFRLVADTAENPASDAIPGYDGRVTIADVQVPKLTHFASNNLETYYWGADNKNSRALEDAFDEFDEYLHYAVIAIGDPDNGGTESQLAVADYMMLAEIEGDSTQSVLRLHKDDGYYRIYISTALNYTGTNHVQMNTQYCKIVNNVLKLYCTVISSTPDELYQAIYDSWETDNTHGINKKTWATIGDAKVKYRLEGNGAEYLIKAK